MISLKINPQIAVTTLALLAASSLAFGQSVAAPVKSADHEVLTKKIYDAVYSGNTFRAVATLRAELENQNGALKAQLNSLLDTISQETADLQARNEGLEKENESILNQIQDNGKQIVYVQNQMDKVAQTQVAATQACANNELIREADDVARQLRTNRYETTLYMPKKLSQRDDSQPGRIDLVRLVVTTAKINAESKGWRNKEVQYYMSKAEDQYSMDNYSGALENYGKAYRIIEAGLAHKFSLGEYLRHLNHDT